VGCGNLGDNHQARSPDGPWHAGTRFQRTRRLVADPDLSAQPGPGRFEFGSWPGSGQGNRHLDSTSFARCGGLWGGGQLAIWDRRTAGKGFLLSALCWDLVGIISAGNTTEFPALHVDGAEARSRSSPGVCDSTGSAPTDWGGNRTRTSFQANRAIGLRRLGKLSLVCFEATGEAFGGAWLNQPTAFFSHWAEAPTRKLGVSGGGGLCIEAIETLLEIKALLAMFLLY